MAGLAWPGSRKMAGYRHLLLPSFIVVFALSFPVDGAEVLEVKVGVVLNMGTLFGRTSLTTIRMALDDFYADYSTRLVIHVRDSRRTTVGAAAAALDLLNNVGVDAILGPQSSSQAVFLSDLAAKAQVPLISFSATSPSLSGRTPFFVRATLNDSAQAPALASLFRSFAWREASLLYEDSEFGAGIIPNLADALLDAGAIVTHRSPIPTSTDALLALLSDLMAKRTRVFVVHANHGLGASLFRQARRLGMMAPGYVWIITDGIAMEMDRDDLGDGSMDGVLGVRPFVDDGVVLDGFTQRWKRRFWQENKAEQRMPDPTMFVLWAYDTVHALAFATERVGVSGLEGGGSGGGSSLLDLGVSRAGPRLLKSIFAVDFEGISGRFRLVNEQLPVVGFQIVNVVANGVIRVVGNWTPLHGLSGYYRGGIVGISWPGGSTVRPRGWEWPVRGTKLKIGVPQANGFLNFAGVRYDDQAGKNVASGFCIDVFEAAMATLGYKVPYEYTVFGNGSYDDFVQQVYLNKFDAAVGDITIWSNRSTYVDFTTPFTESGVVMIVAVEGKRQPFFSFLQPMTYQLWAVTLAAFVVTAFIVWLLEHEDETPIRIPPLDEIGRFLYFSFSTMVVAQREDVRSNLTRAVMIVWVLLTFVLISSYTASLSSMLTSNELQPSFTDASELRYKGEKVGYMKDSFVKSLLIDLGFKESNLVPKNSPEEYAEALSKGSLNGGVAAVFEEIPYVRIFLSKYADKYKVVGRTYKTDGFAFAFPRGSPLVADISHAILKVKEGEQMLNFEKKLYGDLANVPLSEIGNTDSSTNRLSFRRFLVLFLITGSTSLIALFLHFALPCLQRDPPPHQ